MTAFLALRPRRAIGRLYRRHGADVYRYALATVGDPRDAADVTRAAFQRAAEEFERRDGRAERAWLVDLAHDECRLLADCLPTAEELLREAPEPLCETACAEAELALSRRLDGLLEPAEGLELRAHLDGCERCSGFERRQLLQRAAIQRLATVPLPEHLTAL